MIRTVFNERFKSTPQWAFDDSLCANGFGKFVENALKKMMTITTNIGQRFKKLRSGSQPNAITGPDHNPDHKTHPHPHPHPHHNADKSSYGHLIIYENFNWQMICMGVLRKQDLFRFVRNFYDEIHSSGIASIRKKIPNNEEFKTDLHLNDEDAKTFSQLFAHEPCHHKPILPERIVQQMKNYGMSIHSF